MKHSEIIVFSLLVILVVYAVQEQYEIVQPKQYHEASASHSPTQDITSRYVNITASEVGTASVSSSASFSPSPSPSSEIPS